MESRFALTFDLDWVPDFVLEDLYNLILEHRVKATLMVTNASPWLDRFREHPELFELGIHPNFLKGSSHGDTEEAVLDYVLKLVPEAVSSRSHAVVQSGPILNRLTHATPIEVDSTVFLPEQPGIQPFQHRSPSASLVRIPFFWADDYEMCKPQPLWSLQRYQEVVGWKVMLFHPIHTYLNSSSMEQYTQMKQHLPSLQEALPDQVEAYRSSEPGARNMLLEVIKALQQQAGGVHLKEFIRNTSYA
ncbi:MAG: hypothetical protein ACFB10_11380 [Salibacteraceae bacterium]